jgi:hypothetical protein
LRLDQLVVTSALLLLLFKLILEPRLLLGLPSDLVFSCRSCPRVFLVLRKELVDEGEDCGWVLGFHRLLKLVHLIANVVAHLDGLLIIDLEFLPASVFQDRTTSFTSALDLFAPFLMVFNFREKDKVLAGVAHNFDDLEELLEYMGAWPHSQDPWALEGAILLPTGDAFLAEEFSAVVALHRVLQDL